MRKASHYSLILGEHYYVTTPQDLEWLNCLSVMLSSWVDLQLTHTGADVCILIRVMSAGVAKLKHVTFYQMDRFEWKKDRFILFSHGNNKYECQN